MHLLFLVLLDFVSPYILCHPQFIFFCTVCIFIRNNSSHNRGDDRPRGAIKPLRVLNSRLAECRKDLADLQSVSQMY